MKKLYYITFFVAILSSCGQTNKKDKLDIAPLIIKVDDINYAEETSFNDYFKSIELIPLEVDNDAIIGQAKKLLFHQNKFCILDMQQHIVLVFDEQGKFIFKIAKRGQGPGEYPFLDDISINSAGNLELLCAMGIIHEYDLSGNFIKETRFLPLPSLAAVHNMLSLDENTRLFYSGYRELQIVYFDLKEKKILHEDYKEDISSGSSMVTNPNVFYTYNNDNYFYRTISRDVYKIGKDKLELAYTWDLGKYNRNISDIKFSEKAQRDRLEFIKEYQELIKYQFSHIVENDRYIITTFINHEAKIPTNFIYDKSSKQCRNIKKFTDAYLIQAEYITNEYVLNLYNISNLSGFYKESIFDEANKKIYNELINSKDANPVIVKYNFK
jgi:hypothetical protein